MRIFILFFTLLVLFFGAIVGLLGSHAGNQYIISKLNKSDLPLHLTLEQGTVLSQARWKTIDWQGDLLQLSITDLDYQIDLSCLVSAEVCVNSINAAAVHYSMPLKKEPPVLLGIDLGDALTRIAALDDQISNDDWQLHIPLFIRTKNIDISNINVEIANTHITADRLEGAVNLSGRDITVTSLKTTNVFVKVMTDAANSSDIETKLQTVVENSKQLEAVSELLNEFSLYQVSIPLRVDVLDAKLAESKLQVNDLFLDFNRIDLIGFIDAGEVGIEKLNVAMPEADTRLTGEILLQQSYPLFVNVQTTLKQPALLNQLVVDVKAGGSLDKINLSINTSAPVQDKNTNKGHGQKNTEINIKASLSPLKSALPFSIDANWQDLGWPLFSPSFIETTAGSLSLQGDLDDYKITLSGLLDIDNAPLFDLDINGRGDLDGLVLSRVSAETLGGTVTASAKVDWVNEITVSSKIATSGVHLDKYWPDVKLQPSGDVRVDFKLQPKSNNDWLVDVHDINLVADVEGYPLTLQGQLTLNQNLYWRLNNFALFRGEDSIQLDGIINEQFKLGGEMDVKTFAPYISGASGSTFGYFTVIGNKSKPWLNFNLFTDNVSLQDNNLKRAELSGRISLTERPEGVLSLSGEELRIGEQVINKVGVEYQASSASNSLSLNVENDKNNAQLKIAGSWLGDNWQGKVTKGRVNSEYGNWIIDPNVTFSYEGKDNYLAVEQHCWNEKQATLCLGFDGKLDQADKFEFQLHDYDINKLALETANNLEIEGLLNIESEVSWGKEIPLQLNSELSIVNGSMLIYNEEESNTANFETLTMKVGLDESSLSVKANIKSHELGGVSADIRIDDVFTTRELSGNIDIIDIDLSFMEPLIYQVDVLNGVVSGAGVIDGTLDKPKVIGQFNVNNGYLAGDELPVTLESFQFNIEVSGQNAAITGTANSEKGIAKAVGSLAWGDSFNYELLLHGDNFEFDDNKGVKLQFSPKIKITGNDVGAKITGDIVIPSALIKVEQLPQSAIQVSNDVIIIDADNVTNYQSYPLDVEVNIKLLDDVKINSFGLKSDITGAVTIVLDKDGNLFSDGILQFENGRYRSFGQDLYIRQGQVVFSGSIDNPLINVEAIRNTELTEDNVIVGVRLIGPAKKPVFTIFSEPDMEQTRMISYLLRGRDIGSEDETSQDDVLKTLLISSSLGQGEGVIGFVGDTLGVKDFAIDTQGQGNDTRVEMSGYILPGVQIRYGIGIFSALSEVIVRYEIIPKLYIELVSGVDSAVDIYYKFSR
ncbi:translocation/assembly module TamB domain-containing protein [Moritella marina]|uniref:autotransporter assembly complex protein TamB n=1 Tax=Moritella marina TaxID=90736 RepID=UPI0037038F6D